MNYRIEEKEAFDVIEKVETHSIDNQENKISIPDFWTRCHSDGTIDALLNMTNDKTYIFGICYGNQSKNSKTFDYSIAAECDENLTAPNGFRKNKISAQKWLVFTCIGSMPNAMQETWNKIVSEFFPTSGYKPTYEMDIEAYTQGDMNSQRNLDTD
jgi:AraC family transcriptional regulator